MKTGITKSWLKNPTNLLNLNFSNQNCLRDIIELVYLAVEQNDIDFIKKMLNITKVQEAMVLDHGSSLYSSVEHGFIDLFKILIKVPANIEQLSVDEHSTLMLACENNQINIIRDLISLKKTQQLLKADISCLRFAVASKNFEILRLLVRNDRLLIQWVKFNHPDIAEHFENQLKNELLAIVTLSKLNIQLSRDILAETSSYLPSLAYHSKSALNKKVKRLIQPPKQKENIPPYYTVKTEQDHKKRKVDKSSF